jgi:Tfp pilus assembly protein PilF
MIREALAQASWLAWGWQVYGDVRSKKGDVDGARDAYRKAIAMDGRDAYPYLALGFLFESHYRQPAEAEAMYREAVARKWSSDVTDAALNLGRLLAMSGRVAEAADVFEKALRRDPRSEELRHSLDVARRQLGKRNAPAGAAAP